MSIASRHPGAVAEAQGPGGQEASANARLGWVDQLRGLVMVIMALDHVRDFVHRGAMSALPTDLATTTPLLFATRWITHVCAPAFALTAGVGAFLWWSRGRSRAQLSGFLVSRGLWLMLLELVVMRLAYYFSVSLQSPVLLLVLWALGLSMIVLAALVWLPRAWLAPLAIAILLLHPLLDIAPFGAGMSFLHEVGIVQLFGATVVSPYPLIPWAAIMLLGFAMGPAIQAGRLSARSFVGLGVAALAGFVALRLANLYGDPAPWSPQASPVYSLMAFVNVTKYPASLDFTLLTLGLIFLLAALLVRTPGRPSAVRGALEVLGRVPLFYYLLHFFLAHLIATGLALATYGAQALSFVFTPYPSLGGPKEAFPADFGHGLLTVYVVWLVVVAVCYPACLWFAKVKARRRAWWLSYL
ncbi:MAG: DUF1624 domain-containing protein [Caulobacter sp.]